MFHLSVDLFLEQINIFHKTGESNRKCITCPEELVVQPSFHFVSGRSTVRRIERDVQKAGGETGEELCLENQLCSMRKEEMTEVPFAVIYYRTLPPVQTIFHFCGRRFSQVRSITYFMVFDDCPVLLHAKINRFLKGTLRTIFKTCYFSQKLLQESIKPCDEILAKNAVNRQYSVIIWNIYLFITFQLIN